MRRNNLLSAFLVLFLCAPALAQESEPAERLEELEAQIEQGEERVQEQEAEYQRLTQELAAMSERSVEVALEVQTLERRMAGIEDRLTSLQEEEAVTLADLDRRRVVLTDILAALQNVERNKPPALLVQPGDAVDAARSAMLLGAILPELETQVVNLRAQLDALTAVRDAIEREQADLVITAEALAEEETALDELIASREAVTRELAENVEAERARIAHYAAQAENLRGLLNRLTRGGATVGPSLRPSPDMARVVNPFVQARGNLRLPAVGRVLARFGDTLEPGTHSQGVALATRPRARITAPFDSEIVFAAPYRGYGQLLILSPGDGYLILLSGLARIDGVVGQQLLAGEPVGIMGGETLAPNMTRWAVSAEAVEEGGPILYLEMREEGEPVDPLPWFREDQWRVDGS